MKRADSQIAIASENILMRVLPIVRDKLSNLKKSNYFWMITTTLPSEFTGHTNPRKQVFSGVTKTDSPKIISLGIKGVPQSVLILTIILAMTLGFSSLVSGQTTIYSQDFGTGTSFPTGWSASSTSTWSVSTSTSSSGYIDASGGSNLSSGSSGSSRTVTVAGVISTINCANVSILWGARKAHTNAVTCDWSSNGYAWNAVSFTDVANNSTWALVNGGTRINLPSGAAGTDNLRIRWNYDSDGTSGRYRIDDFSVVATPAFASQFISMNIGSTVWCAGETRTITVTAKNVGSATWTNATPDINIGVKWNADADYFIRTDASGLAPGATQTYSLTVTAPSVGSNNLTFDVVNEGNCWFGNNNGNCGPGNSVFTSSNITIINSPPAQPSSITGNSIPCAGSSQNYSITNVAGVAYNWSFPVGWTKTGGENTNSVTVTVGEISGNVQVTPSNVCGNGTPRTLTTTVSQPSATVTNQKNITCYAGNDGSISILGNGGTSPYEYSVDNGTSWVISNDNPYSYGGLKANEPYKIRVKDNNGCESISIP